MEAGQFHIHPVDHVEEAIELLTGCVAGEPDMPDTLFGRIQQRLDELNGTEAVKGACCAACLAGCSGYKRSDRSCLANICTLNWPGFDPF